MVTNPFEEINLKLDAMDATLSLIRQELPNKIANPEKPLRLKEAADYLGIAEQTLYAYISQGKIKPFKTGKFNLFYRSALDAFVRGERPEQLDGSLFLKRNKKPQP